jgi:hypothetical protein
LRTFLGQLGNLYQVDKFSTSKYSQQDFTSKSPDFLRILATLVYNVFNLPFTSPQTRLDIMQEVLRIRMIKKLQIIGSNKAD